MTRQPDEAGAARMQRAINTLWKFTGELPTGVHVDEVAARHGIGVDPATGGRDGRHTEHLGYLLAEMQFMQRAYPGMEW